MPRFLSPAQGVRAAATLCLACSPLTLAQESPTLVDVALYGIDREEARLVQYRFDTRRAEPVGEMRNTEGDLVRGVDAAGAIAGHSNVYGLWTDPDDNRQKLLYISVADARVHVRNDDLEGGHFGGATTADLQGLGPTLVAVQHEEAKPPAEIRGLVNINPNNSGHNEFAATLPQGVTLTRDHLHEHANVNARGTIYEGPASFVHLKPKGNGNQNGITLDGEPMTLRNANTYAFVGEMTIRVYNDRLHGGKAMGHWWIQIIDGQVRLEDDIAVLSPHLLVQVDHRDGTVTELMRLSRAYTGLATTDGNTYYAAAGRDVYRIQLAQQTETKIGQSNAADIVDLECVLGRVFAYDNAGQTLFECRDTIDRGYTESAGIVRYDLGTLGPLAFHQHRTGPAPASVALALFD